jgi:Uma2 family endonuclease
MTKKPALVCVCELVAGAVESLLPRGWYIREQNPLRIPDYDEPEPDVVVARGSRGTYVSRHPGPEDVALVVEVADTSLMRDRGEKLSAYSRGGVPVYWIVNLTGGTPPGSGQVEVYSDPDLEQGRYRGKAFHDRSSSVPVVVEGTELGWISVAEILPPQTR